MAPYPCHSCAAHDAIVFCPVDAARLCLYCDAAVHGASTLAGLHPRAPLCDSCGAAPASLRCDATFTLCADCCRRAPPCTTRTGITHYTGCPGPTELMRLLSVEAPQPQEEFDAWLADLLLDDSAMAAPEIPPPCNDATSEMCDVAIAVAKIEKLLADHQTSTDTSSSLDAAALLLQSDGTELNNGLPCFGATSSSEPTVSLLAEPQTMQDPSTNKKREERERAKLRYKEKRKNRSLGNRIIYACRKQIADTRKRLKGRFTKASSHDKIPSSENSQECRLAADADHGT